MHTVPGVRGYGCVFPGCGRTFNTPTAVVRHALALHKRAPGVKTTAGADALLAAVDLRCVVFTSR